MQDILTGFHLFAEFRDSVFRQRLQPGRCPRDVVGRQQRTADRHVDRAAELRGEKFKKK